MTRDDDFEPKLGKIRASGDSVRSRLAQEVERAIAREGGRKRGASSRRRTFDGSRIGRGAGVGRVLASRDRRASQPPRRDHDADHQAGRPRLKGARTHLRCAARQNQSGSTRDS